MNNSLLDFPRPVKLIRITRSLPKITLLIKYNLLNVMKLGFANYNIKKDIWWHKNTNKLEKK